MATGLKGKLWIQTRHRTGEGWVPPDYSCLKHVISLASQWPNELTKLVMFK